MVILMRCRKGQKIIIIFFSFCIVTLFAHAVNFSGTTTDTGIFDTMLEPLWLGLQKNRGNKSA